MAQIFEGVLLSPSWSCGFNEIKECCKGHSQLHDKLAGESMNYIGKRHGTCLMNDAYGKGILRGQGGNNNF